MRNKFRLIILTLFIVTVNLSCDKEDLSCNNENNFGVVSPIVDTALPTVGNVGQEINFIVSHTVFSGCGYYSSQETNQIGTTLIVIFYTENREGVCTMDNPIRKTNYKFVPTKAGVYTFKFNGGETGCLTQTILIQ